MISPSRPRDRDDHKWPGRFDARLDDRMLVERTGVAETSPAGRRNSGISGASGLAVRMGDAGGKATASLKSSRRRLTGREAEWSFSEGAKVETGLYK